MRSRTGVHPLPPHVKPQQAATQPAAAVCQVRPRLQRRQKRWLPSMLLGARAAGRWASGSLAGRNSSWQGGAAAERGWQQAALLVTPL